MHKSHDLLAEYTVYCTLVKRLGNAHCSPACYTQWHWSHKRFITPNSQWTSI